MNLSFDDEVPGTSDLAATAARARELAQQIIVSEFSEFVRGRGPGPTDRHLKMFAKLAVVEQALVREEPIHVVAPRLRVSRGETSFDQGASA